MPKCYRCGKEFDLFRYGAPGNPNRKICWDCESPHFAKPTPVKGYVSFEELDNLEDKCLDDIVD